LATQTNGTAKPEAATGFLHFCPTRVDRTPVLVAHRVSMRQCQERQRGHYHKCFTCAWQNVRIAANGRPPEIEAAEAAERRFVRA